MVATRQIFSLFQDCITFGAEVFNKKFGYRMLRPVVNQQLELDFRQGL